MKDMFDRARAGVREHEAVALTLLLIKYRGFFAEYDIDLEDFLAVKHVIDTKDARPVKQRPRLTPLAFEGENEHRKKPTVLVRKRDGTVRYGIALRKVTEVTIKDRYQK